MTKKSEQGPERSKRGQAGPFSLVAPACRKWGQTPFHGEQGVAAIPVSAFMPDNTDYGLNRFCFGASEAVYNVVAVQKPTKIAPFPALAPLAMSSQ